MTGRRVLSAILMTLTLAACGGSTPQADSPPASDLPATLSLVEPDDVAALLADARGKVAIVNVWATWCPPCIAEIPDLIAFHKSANADEIALIGLSTDDPEAIEDKVKPFLKDKGVTFPVYVMASFDPEAYEPALKTELDGNIPVSLFYDKQGELKRVHTGALTEEELRETVMSVLR